MDAQTETPKSPLYVPEGVDEGRVADVGAARELAGLEHQLRNREVALQKEFDPGLADYQKVNIEIMNGLEEKYPLAFNVHIDDKGRKVLGVNVWEATPDSWQRRGPLGSHVFVSQEGVFTRARDHFYFDEGLFDYGRILDRFSQGDYIEKGNSVILDSKDAINEKGKKETWFSNFSDKCDFRRIDLGDPESLSSLKIIFKDRQDEVLRRQQEQGEKQAKIDPGAVLSQF